MERVYKCAIAIIILMVSFPVVAADSTEISQAAEKAYSNGEYAKCVELYDSLISEKGESAEVLYNRGNAYAKSGDYGHAMIDYLQARELKPNDPEIRNNIKYIESKVHDNNTAELKGKKQSVDPESASFFMTIKKYIAEDHLSDTWAVWSVIAFLIFVAGISVYTFSGSVIYRKIGFFGGLSCLLISIVALVFALTAASDSERIDKGVIVGYKVKLRSDASISSKEGATALTRGTVLNILGSYPEGEEAAQWYKVRLNSDFVGWIQADDFEPVNKRVKK